MKNWKPKFIEALAHSANVSAACRAVGIDRRTAYKAREASRAFAADWDDAITEAIESLEAEAWRRAREGTKREDPIFYQGMQVGEKVVTEYSDTLLIVLLKAHRPTLYRDPPHYPIDFSKLTNEQLDRLAAGEHPATVLGDRSRSGKVPTQQPAGESFIN